MGNTKLLLTAATILLTLFVLWRGYSPQVECAALAGTFGVITILIGTKPDAPESTPAKKTRSKRRRIVRIPKGDPGD